jgi:hypothetical protein
VVACPPAVDAGPEGCEGLGEGVGAGAPLGTTTRRARALRDAGITPADLVTETIPFSRHDLEHAWEAHAQGTHHDAMAALTPQQAQAFRRDCTSALARLLRSDADHLLTSEVIYAFGSR